MAQFSVANTPNALITFVKQAREELKKVTWPTREQTIRYTIVVIIASVVVGLFTGGVDYLFTTLVRSLIH